LIVFQISDGHYLTPSLTGLKERTVSKHSNMSEDEEDISITEEVNEDAAQEDVTDLTNR